MNTHYTAKQLKATAREQLRSNWKSSVGISAFMLLLSLLFLSISFTSNSYFTVILSYAYPVLEGVFQVGVLSFFLKIACGYGYQSSLRDLYYGFKNKPGTIILLYLLFVLLSLPTAVIALIASIICVVLALTNFTTPLILCITISIALVVVYTCYISLTYGMVYYLFLDYPDVPVLDLMKRSKKLMIGNRLRLLYLNLSFLPLQFLSALSFQIGSLWVTPYVLTTKSLFYLSLVQNPSTINKEKEEWL